MTRILKAVMNTLQVLILIGVMFSLPLIGIGLGEIYEYINQRDELAAQQEHDRMEMVRQQEFERTCEWVAVAGGDPNGLSWIGVELRAKPGVTREHGFKICGKKAFKRGREVYVVSKQVTALGRNARVASRTD